MKHIQFKILLGMAVVVLTALGCGAESGPQRFALSGAVTFDGKPVPRGEINFVPDASKNNPGPAAFARIQDGRYQTAEGEGTIGGPHVVTLSGYDGVAVASPEGGQFEDGSPLFEGFEISVDLPKQAGTHDFEVPASAAGAGTKSTPAHHGP